MNKEELAAVHDKLVELAQAGNEQAAEAYLIEQMPRLPEDLRKEIIARAYFESLVDEAEETEAIAAIQERGLAAIEVLENALKELSEESANIDK